MDRLEPIDSNERAEVCRACGGECCRTRPGAESPERFLAEPDPVGALALALDSGDWVVAHRVGIPFEDGTPPPEEIRWRTILYVRPASRAERHGDGAPAQFGSQCVFLGESGCRLSFADRPRVCQSLEPWADGECRAGWDEGAAAKAWLAHQDLLARAQARRRPR